MDRNVTLVAIATLIGFLLSACSDNQSESNNVKEDYIVVFGKQARGQVATKAMVTSMMEDTTAKFKLGKATRIFNVAIQGGVVEMTAEQALEIAKEPGVAYVEKDQGHHSGCRTSQSYMGLRPC